MRSAAWAILLGSIALGAQEGTVSTASLSGRELIDREVQSALEEQGLKPSPRSDDAELRVNTPPTIIEPPVSIAVRAGTNAVFTVKAAGTDPRLTHDLVLPSFWPDGGRERGPAAQDSSQTQLPQRRQRGAGGIKKRRGERE